MIRPLLEGLAVAAAVLISAFLARRTRVPVGFAEAMTVLGHSLTPLKLTSGPHRRAKLPEFAVQQRYALIHERG